MGMTFDTFMNMSPWEFRIKLDAHIKELKVKNNSIIVQSWLTTYLIRCSIVSAFNKEAKFPELSKLLNPDEPKKEQTPEQMEEAMRSICIAFGGQIIEVEG